MKIHTDPIDGGAFRSHPAREWELEPDRIACNDITLPGEGPGKLWVIWNEYGAVCAVWGRNEQDALDAMVDEDLGKTFLVSEEDQKKALPEEQENWAGLGNASEPCDLANAYMAPVTLDKVRDYDLIIAFAEARGARADKLNQVL
jgi:hypothetical protein